MVRGEPKYTPIGDDEDTMIIRESLWRKWRYVLSAIAILAVFWCTAPFYLLGSDNADSALEKSVYSSSDRPLITYAYYETENARENAEYFIKHAIHDGADFMFILNGKTDLYKLLPDVPYVNYVQRPNECFDLGSHGAVLLSHKGELVKKYKRFILMNASIRGPFVPVWSDACWSDKYLSRVTDKVKLVGMTYNCKKSQEVPAHVSSMIWATDRIGLDILLKNGMDTCFTDKLAAIGVEVTSTKWIHEAGYQVEAMMSAFHTDPKYEEHCNHDDPNWEGAYFGMTMHPFDTMFIKANRGINENVIDMYTGWMGDMKYDSHQYCGTKRKPTRLRTVGERLAEEDASMAQE